MFLKYPFSKTFAPKKDGVYVVKFQGKVSHIGIAVQKETGRNLRQEMKYLYNKPQEEYRSMHDNKELTSVKFITTDSYQQALQEFENLKVKYQKRLEKLGKL